MSRWKLLGLLLLLPVVYLLGANHVMAQTENSWPMVAGNPQRTSWTPEQVSGNLHLEWYKPIDAFIPLYSHVIAANDTLFISTSKGLYALNAADGSNRWRFDTEVPLGNSPTYANGVVYVGGFDRKLYAINANTGAVNWTFSGAKAGYDTNPVVADGKVMLGNRDGTFYAVNTSNGTLAWSYTTGGPIRFSAAYKNGVVYFASNDNYGYALNTTNGALVWKTPQMLGDGFKSFWAVLYTNPIDSQDYVIFVTSSGYRTFTKPGLETLSSGTCSSCNDPYLCTYQEWSDEWNGNICGTLGTAAASQSWAGSNAVYDFSKIADYLEQPTAQQTQADPLGTSRHHQKPWRRYYYIFNTQTGQEWSMDSDGDGYKEYTPIDPFLSNSGNPYPPVSNQDAAHPVPSNSLLYFGNHFMPDNDSRFFGWRMGTSLMASIGGSGGAGDEPNGLSIGGSLLYRTIINGRTAESRSITGTGGGGLVWGYGAITSLPEFNTHVWCASAGWSILEGLYCNWYGSSGINGVYNQGEDENALVPYKGRVYNNVYNFIVAYGTGSSNSRNAGRISPATVTQSASLSLADLKARLETEVAKFDVDNNGILDHLRPGYYNVGQFNQVFNILNDYFSAPGDTIYSLSIAYPYLSPGLQAKVKAYLKTEFNNFNSVNWQGASRQWAPLPPEVEADMQSSAAQGRLDKYYAYGLWKYAANVADPADKAAIVAKANSLTTSNLGDYQLNQAASNRDAAGNIGLDRLNGNSTSTVSNCSWFSKDSPWTQQAGYIRRTLNIARNFMFLTPEVGDCLNKNATARGAIAEYILNGPYWFVSRYTSSIGEATMQSLYDYPSLFQAKAFVLKQSREELTKWLDVPAFKIGDLFYIQNLVSAIEAPSDGSPTPIPTTTQPTSTPVPTPPNWIPGDANGDGRVDGIDYVTWLNHYNALSTHGPSDGDFNNDSRVDGIDYVIWLNNYGR